jgi:aspartate/methionine/tyrosine aminotransferase
MIRVDDPGGRSDERFVLDLLQETGVLVVHGSVRSESSAGYFRMVYLADEATLEIVFNLIGQFLARYL